MNTKRFITFLLAALVAVSACFAQSSGDKLYNQGLQLQKTMTVSAQNQAISKFTSAKKLYDSAAKKAQCDQAISVSRNIIKQIQSGGGKAPSAGSTQPKTQTKVKTEVRKVDPTLSVDNKEFNVGPDKKVLTVNVTTNQDKWDVNTVSCDDGSSFLNVIQSGPKSFQITVSPNTQASRRSQKVRVSSNGMVQEVTVNQSGVPVKLDVNKKSLKFKEKEGKQKVKITSNCTETYEDNNGTNWYVESKPDWVEVLFLDSKSKCKNGACEVASNVQILCHHLVPGTAAAHAGRKGDIVIRSGDKTISIFVSQVGKAGTVW